MFFVVQRSGLALLPVRARKQSKKQDVGQDADLASDVLPADLQKLSKLAKVGPSYVNAAPTWPAATQLPYA